MLETVTLALSLVAFFLSLLAFITSATAAVIVIGWKNSTHKVIQMPSTVDPLMAETRTEYDLPQEILDQLPSNPETPTPERYVARMQAQAEAQRDVEENYAWNE